MQRLLRERPDLRREAARLERALGLMPFADVTAPPPDLRARILEAAQPIERAPHTAGLFDGLGDDHVHLDATMAAIGAAITADDRPALSAAATGFAALLDAHLTREESVVFPAIVEHVGGEAFGRIERQINADVSMRDLSFDVPWLFDDAPAELRARLVGGAPAALRLLLRLVWEPRYRRTSAVVRGGAR